MNDGNNRVGEKDGHVEIFSNSSDSLLEKIFLKKRRKTLWDKAHGKNLLEVGVGKGENFPYYPDDTQIIALDFNQNMLKKARQRRSKKNIKVELVLMDVHSLCYDDNSFDTIVGTFVFCSISNPIQGLQELYRVCKPDGQVLLLEYVLSSNPVKAFFMRMLNPLVSLTFSSNINRKTLENIKSCGFSQVIVDPTSSGTIKIIQAIK